MEYNSDNITDYPVPRPQIYHEDKANTIPFSISDNTNSTYYYENSNYDYNSIDNTNNSDYINYFDNTNNKFFELNMENNRLDIMGFSLDLDTIIILGILFFVLAEDTLDITLIIPLGLMLLNFGL